jgi:hypothetical protein
MRIRALLLSAAFISTGIYSHRDICAPFSNIQQAYLQFKVSQDRWQNRGVHAFKRNISSFYDNTFNSFHNEKSLSKLSDADLHIIFRAAHDALFYTNNVRYLNDIRLDYDILSSRGIASDLESGQIFRSLVRLRRFDAARYFSFSHSEIKLELLPRVWDLRTETGRPSIMAVDSEAPDLYLHNFHIKQKGPEIIVVGHPRCHFTQNAVKAIEKNLKIHYLMQRYSTWISPQDGRIDVASFQFWNREHGDFPIAITWQESQWSSIDDWETPVFYFFSDGILKDKVVGWPRQGNATALIRGLRAIGAR